MMMPSSLQAVSKTPGFRTALVAPLRPSIFHARNLRVLRATENRESDLNSTRTTTSPPSSVSSPPPPVKPVTPESAQELLEELFDLEKIGTRGEGWFLAQAVLILLVVFPPSGLRQIVDTLGGCLCLGGLALITVGGLNLGQNLTPVPRPRDKDHTLVTDGIYQLCRHPMYGGIILGALGLALFTGDEARLGLSAVMFLVLDQKANVEEEYLEDKYPREYDAYKRSGVKKFIPWLY